MTYDFDLEHKLNVGRPGQQGGHSLVKIRPFSWEE